MFTKTVVFVIFVAVSLSFLMRGLFNEKTMRRVIIHEDPSYDNSFGYEDYQRDFVINKDPNINFGCSCQKKDIRTSTVVHTNETMYFELVDMCHQQKVRLEDDIFGKIRSRVCPLASFEIYFGMQTACENLDEMRDLLFFAFVKSISSLTNSTEIRTEDITLVNCEATALQSYLSAVHVSVNARSLGTDQKAAEIEQALRKHSFQAVLIEQLRASLPATTVSQARRTADSQSKPKINGAYIDISIVNIVTTDDCKLKFFILERFPERLKSSESFLDSVEVNSVPNFEKFSEQVFSVTNMKPAQVRFVPLNNFHGLHTDTFSIIPF
jgi:hypothetical protein